MAQGGSNSFAVDLCTAGLDVAYWRDIFRDDIKRTNVADIRLHCDEVYAIAEKNARDDWEKVMLKDFLGIMEDSNVARKIAKQTWEERKAALQEMFKNEMEETRPQKQELSTPD